MPIEIKERKAKYYSKGNDIFRKPDTVTDNDGTTYITTGFKVCTIDDECDEHGNAAYYYAMLLNLGDAAEDFKKALEKAGLI